MDLTGLTEHEAGLRLKKYGENKLEIKRHRSLILQFFDEFKDIMVIILIAASVFSLLAGEWQDGSVIMFIVILNAVIGFVQKFRAERAVEALKKMVAPHAKVIRDGKVKDIEARFLVPGDLIVLAEGDSIGADAYVVEENELETDESTLTGESMPVVKDPEHKLYMGTNVVHGTGKAIIEETGMNTRFGKIAHLTTTTKKDESPLQKELNKIGIFVGKTTLVISGVLLLVGVFFQGQPFVHALLFAAAVAVAAVPEGLPATITIALALGVQRLAEKKAIVKQLSSVETLGATTVICSDKTGTLTQNRMTVEEIYSPDFVIDMNKKTNFNKRSLLLIAKIGMLCNDSKVQKQRKKWKVLGDPTEGALKIAIEKLGFKEEALEKTDKRIYEIPFDSIRKKMSVVVKEGNKYISLVKGAPDSVIEECKYILVNGKKKKLDAKTKKELIAKNEEMAKRALRVLAFAYKDIEKQKKKYSKDELEENLTFIGLAGMIDPPRPEVKHAIEMAKKAGIRTYIVTGDHGLTAHAIAKEIGLADNKTRIITGDEFEKISKRDLKKLLKDKGRSIIFARSKPEHKLRIVECLKELGEIVAVTGDGVNDAPALKRSDIGIAMGITGTDVSREAANMVLADDSYSTIVTAIEEGRKIYSNLKKFVFYIFSCNVGELLTVFTGIILGLPAPLTAVLILAVDLGTDVLPAIALGIDPVEAGIMDKPPRNQKQKIMEGAFVKRFLFLGLTIGIVVIGTFIWTLTSNGWQWGQSLSSDSLVYVKASTMAFVILVIIQMINAFNARSETRSVFKPGMKRNYKLVGAIIISIILTVAFVEVPFLQEFLRTTSLSLKEWGVIVVASLFVLVAEETRKLFVRRSYA
ncbi:MAG: cation-transporting P-type ATPase [Patescibacteria group bacterium]|nr:cation-transporting P-type ATPase [Patescibacteria group bacterium]